MKAKVPIRHCPICKLAMLASKSREDLERPDAFRCLNCGMEIIETPRQPQKRQEQRRPSVMELYKWMQ